MELDFEKENKDKTKEELNNDIKELLNLIESKDRAISNLESPTEATESFNKFLHKEFSDIEVDCHILESDDKIVFYLQYKEGKTNVTLTGYFSEVIDTFLDFQANKRFFE